MSASSCSVNPMSGERSTPIKSTSCRGLSITLRKDAIVPTSAVSSRPPRSSALAETPACSSAAMNVRALVLGERSRMTMSPGVTGRSAPVSLSVTGKPSSSSCRMRAAASRASSAVLSGASSSSPRFAASTSSTSVR